MSEDFIYQKVREVLLKSDWQSEDLLFEPVMYIRGRVYRPDIVLLYNLYPLAVAEIKRNLDSPELVGQLPSAAALGYPLVVANRADAPRNSVGRRRP
jgi:hypothetical protein